MSTESLKPKRRFTRLARNVTSRSKEEEENKSSNNGQENVVTAISAAPIEECNHATDTVSTSNSASIPSDMLYILQELNDPVIESNEQKIALASTSSTMTPARRSTRLNKSTVTKEQTATSTPIPNDMLYIMNSLNEAADDTQHSTQKSTEVNDDKQVNKRKLAKTTINADEVEEINGATEHDKTLARTDKKKKKVNKSKDARSSSKPSTWMDRDQQAVDALEQLTQSNAMDDDAGKDFNALLMEHISIADSKVNKKSKKKGAASKANNLPASIDKKETSSGASMTKIRFCYQWQRAGYCERGDRCPYSHEVPPEIAREAIKKPNGICRALRIHGSCPLGIRCPWSHDLSETDVTNGENGIAAIAATSNGQRDSTQVTPTSTASSTKKSVEFCRFFKSGSCGKGLWCNFSHNLKLEPCYFYAQRGYCEAGDECRFSHVSPSLEDQSTMMTGDKSANDNDTGIDETTQYIPPEKWIPILPTTTSNSNHDGSIAAATSTDGQLTFGGLSSDLIYDP
ncbi:hypothetical protein BDF22DRAFT_733495 [Syncephalis plumigaleata]|nr:hypothetical protein BDF22DRAFT_733495 [Syncephalis plumigaleata]